MKLVAPLLFVLVATNVNADELTGTLKKIKESNTISLGVRETFSDLGATVGEWLNVPFRGHGQSFLPALERGA